MKKIFKKSSDSGGFFKILWDSLRLFEIVWDSLRISWQFPEIPRNFEKIQQILGDSLRFLKILWDSLRILSTAAIQVERQQCPTSQHVESTDKSSYDNELIRRPNDQMNRGGIRNAESGIGNSPGSSTSIHLICHWIRTFWNWMKITDQLSSTNNSRRVIELLCKQTAPSSHSFNIIPGHIGGCNEIISIWIANRNFNFIFNSKQGRCGGAERIDAKRILLWEI